MGVVAGAWYGSGAALDWAVPRYLRSAGIGEGKFHFHRPSSTRLQIDDATVHLAGFEIAASGIVLEYSLDSLLVKRLRAITVGTLAITVTNDAAADESGGSVLPDLPGVWALLPVDRIRVDRLTVVSIEPDARVTGTIDLDPDRVSADLHVQSRLLPAPLDAHVGFDPAGGIRLILGAVGETPALRLQGVPDGAGEMAIEGEIHLGGETMALLCGLADLPFVGGDIGGTVAGRLPWPLPEDLDLSQVTVESTLQVALLAGFAGITAGHAAGEITVAVGEGQLHLTSEKMTLGAETIAVGGSDFVITPGSEFDAAIEVALPLDALSEALSAMDGRLTLAVNMGVKSVPGTVDLRGVGARGSVVVTVGHGELQVVAQDFAIRADTARFDGVTYELAPDDEVRLGVDATLPLTGLDALLESLVLSATVDVNLTLQSDSPAALANSLSVSTRLTASIRPGQRLLDIAPGGTLDLVVADLEAGFKTNTRAALSVNEAADTVAVTDLSLTVRIPTISILDQRLAFRSGKIEFAGLKFSGDSWVANGVLHSRSAAEAVPVAFRTTLNTSRMDGDFELSVAGKVRQPLLRSELSGWRSDYDLDGGDLTVQLAGQFSGLSEVPRVVASGRVGVTDGTEHYDDMMATGIRTELPITIDGDVVHVGPGEAQLAAVEVGVPVTGVHFQLDSDLTVTTITDVKATVLGGEVRVERLVYDGETADFAVQVEGLPVAAIVALEGEDIVGDGILDGVLPVTLVVAGVSVVGGRLAARPPGGRLSYRGSLPATNPALDLAVRALRNFQYSKMDVEVNLSPAGALGLLVKLQGRSPDVEQGRPIHFNLNVSEDIPALLESLRASEEMTDRIQQRLSR